MIHCLNLNMIRTNQFNFDIPYQNQSYGLAKMVLQIKIFSIKSFIDIKEFNNYIYRNKNQLYIIYLINKNMENNPEQTFEMIECGNLELNFPIDRAVLLLGQTKAGKTTTSHFLVKQLLEPHKNDVGNIVYKIKAGDSKYENYDIGLKEHVSQTQIPNIFVNSIFNPPIHLVDCPGYLDTQGCSRVLSNGFFHYKIFQQSKQVKFVLTIQYSDFEGTATNLRNTFQAFYNSFQNFKKDLNDILAASCLMVTKVPFDKEIKQVAQRLEKCQPFRTGKKKQIFQEFKKNILAKNKLFIFKLAQIGSNCNNNNDLFERINAATEFWSHSMDQIKVSIKDKMLKKSADDEQFYEELQIYGDYFKENLELKMMRFPVIIKQLQDEAYNISTNLGNNGYLSMIKQYTNQIVQPKENDQKSQYFKFRNKRNQTRQKIIQQSLKELSFMTTSSQETPLWLQKIDIIDKFNKRLSSLGSNIIQSIEYSMEGIKQYSEIAKNLMFQIIKINRENIVPNSYLAKFCYDFISTLNISNSFYEILEDKENQQKNMDINSPLAFILVQYPNILKDSLIHIIEDSPLTLKIKFLLNNNIRSDKLFMKRQNYTSIHNFVLNLRKQIQLKRKIDLNAELDVLKKQKDFDGNQKGEKGIDDFIYTLCSIERGLGLENFNHLTADLGSKSINIQKVCEIISSLESIRAEIEGELIKYLDDTKLSFKTEGTLNQRIIRSKCINLMALAMEKIQNKDSEQLAIDLYDFNCNSHKIMQLFASKQTSLNRRNAKGHEKILFLIRYIKMANKYERNIAFEKHSEAMYEAIQHEDQDSIKKLDVLATELLTQKQTIQNLSFQSYSCKPFFDSLKSKIQQFIKNVDSQNSTIIAQ